MSLFQYNIDAFRVINDLGKQYPSLEPMIIFVAEYTVYFLALLMLFYWFTGLKQNRMMAIYSIFAFIVAEVIGKTVGLFHSNHQPFAVLSDVNQLVQHEIDNSFPSDHTILFFSICTSIWLVRKKEGWIWMILACCVATSRILVGVHYPFDVAVGALIGILSAVLVYKFAPKMSFIKQLLFLYEKIESNVLPAKKQMKN